MDVAGFGLYLCEQRGFVGGVLPVPDPFIKGVSSTQLAPNWGSSN